MDNQELQAIQGMFETLMTGQQEMKQEINGIKQEINGIKQEVNGIKQEVNGIKQEQQKTNERLSAIEVTLENEIKPNVQLLAEGHGQNVKHIETLEEDVSEIKESVSILKLLTVKK